MMTLNQLIDELTKVREANPALGDLPVTMEDQELGTLYPVDLGGVEVESTGTMLACR